MISPLNNIVWTSVYISYVSVYFNLEAHLEKDRGPLKGLKHV